MVDLRVLAISDTHGMHRSIPKIADADVLIHAGDFTNTGARHEVVDFIDWFASQPHKVKIATPGNHDRFAEIAFDESARIFKKAGANLLCNRSMTVGGVKIWASPVTPRFGNWSFMLRRGNQIRSMWKCIPDDVDVLITHGPPYGHGDLVPPYGEPYSRHAGCLELLNRLREIKDAQNGRGPQAHIFGHIHAGHGVTMADEFPETVFVNAAICTEEYLPTNSPLGVHIHKKV